ncbi:hypothetical protein AB0I81_50775 [Nonomuraea sp. NPDC050404]|uniref:hypothetical protein n=1 Tax=Nonomuraea sp. NPDC050404 TaxID=3155783 RepID=UPI0033CA9A3D
MKSGAAVRRERAAAQADEEAGRQDRRRAREDRQTDATDRAEAARDREATLGDREQAEIERQMVRPPSPETGGHDGGNVWQDQFLADVQDTQERAQASTRRARQAREQAAAHLRAQRFTQPPSADPTPEAEGERAGK